MAATQDQVLAFAVCEIRQLLAGYLGSGPDTHPTIRAAAHLAYALHNQALGVLHGSSFDVSQAVSAVEAVDRMLATDFKSRLAQTIASET